MPNTILDELTGTFVTHAIKTVAPNDTAKGAYYPNAQQRAVMAAAGFQPVSSALQRLIPIRVIGTDAILDTTYYNAERDTPGRAPEPRMGRGLINWVNPGDELLLGTDGVTVFARKLSPTDRVVQPPAIIEAAVEQIYSEIDPKRLLSRAAAAAGAPPKSAVTSDVFIRDPAVKAFALRRCGGKCEVPGCTYVPFLKDDGTPFVEVHHIEFLGDGGDDTILNTAGVCPTCHRRAHYGPNRAQFAATLLKAVDTATKAFVASL